MSQDVEQRGSAAWRTASEVSEPRGHDADSFFSSLYSLARQAAAGTDAAVATGAPAVVAGEPVLAKAVPQDGKYCFRVFPGIVCEADV